jgi:SAM-dependent methyltransferase
VTAGASAPARAPAAGRETVTDDRRTTTEGGPGGRPRAWNGPRPDEPEEGPTVGDPAEPDDPGSRSSEWRRFFEVFADRYDIEDFTRSTADELVFLQETFDLRAGDRLLDVGCGTGRHLVPLASSGLRATGVDLSPAMLERARARAAQADVDVQLVEADARDLPADLGPFDAAICLCEGAFCLVDDVAEPMAHDRAILASIHRALRPGGRLVLTALNAARLLRDWGRGELTGELDLLTLTETSTLEPAEGTSTTVREHYHLPATLRLLAEHVGFEVEAVWAGGAGDWRRDPPTEDDMELLLVARRPGVTP